MRYGDTKGPGNVRTVLLLLLACCSLLASGWEEKPELDALFAGAGVEGTFVLCEVGAVTCTGHDAARAARRYIPASTFKIANALIGLSTGAVESVDEILPYTGPAKPFIPAWAHDMDLRDAIALSNVPIFQELARRIGLKRMREGLVELRYGNEKVGDAVDRFWLDGPLRISALEQAALLSGLVQDALPLPKAVQESVRDIVPQERGDGWRLHGKTGWQNAPGPGVGWWVGWVEKQGRFYVFALNIDITSPADAEKRVTLGKACLKSLGVI